VNSSQSAKERGFIPADLWLPLLLVITGSQSAKERGFIPTRGKTTTLRRQAVSLNPLKSAASFRHHSSKRQPLVGQFGLNPLKSAASFRRSRSRP